MSKKSLISRTVVDEDDLCEIIYHMLWNKNVFYPSSALPVFVPDTVMFRSGTPIAWYFSDSEGIIKRKKEPKLTIQHVQETFIKKKSKYGIVAYYIHLPETQGYNYNEEEDEAKQKTIIEYYDEPAFIKLMSNPNQKLKRGILQRFIDPQGEKNSLIQCVWTKRISMFNRRTNSRLLKDTTANIYEKCVTFEGPAYMSESTAMKGNALGVKVKEALDFIINHISNATFERYQVSKLVCYFKVDQQSRIWYLFSGFFRVNKKVLDIALKTGRNNECAEQIDLNDNFTIPSNIHVGAKMVGAYRKPEETLETCPRCSNIFSSSNFVEITYKAIMDAAERPADIKPKEEEFENAPNIGMILAPEQTVNKEDEQELHVRNKQEDIPYIIRKVHQRLRSHEFEKIKNEDYFKIKKTKVCYSCYFYLSKTNIMAGNDQNPNSIQEKIRNPRPIGQTLSMNDKLKTINKSNNKENSVSVSRISSTKRVPAARANSVGSFDPRRQLVSLKRDMDQVSRIQGSTFENNIVMKSRERAKESYKEEAILYELQRLQSREEFTHKLATGEANEILKQTAPIDLLSQPNIFETREAGKIVRLESIPQRNRSVANISMPEVTPLSRSSSYSRKSNNYMDALYTIIQGSPRTGNKDYHKVSFIPEQTERLDSDEENMSRQLLMADPINLSSYRKTAKLSKLPIRETVEQRTFSQGSLSERIPRSSSQGLLYKAYLAKQTTATGENTHENSRNRSTQKSNITFKEKEKDASLGKDTGKNQFTQNVKGTIKLYMGKVPAEKLPATKTGFDLLKFINDKREGIKLNQAVITKENTQKKKINKKHVSEIFRPLGRASNIVLVANPSQNTQVVKSDVFSVAEPVREVEIRPVEMKSNDIVPVSDKSTPKLNQEVTEPVTTINEMVEPVVSHNDHYSEQRKVSEPTLISQFPTYTNHSLPPFRSNETPHRLKKITVTKEDERERLLTTELEYSLTQPLKSSMLRKDTHSQKGEMDNESRKSRSISPPQEDKGNIRNREPYLKRVPDEQFNELTAKPFSSRKSIKKNDSNLMMSRNSGLYESQRTNQEENRVLPPNLMTEEDDREVVSAFSAEDQKSGLSKGFKKSEDTSHGSSQQIVSEEYKDSNKSISGKDEKYSEKISENKSLTQLIGSMELNYEQGNQESETIKVEDERRPSL